MLWAFLLIPLVVFADDSLPEVNQKETVSNTRPVISSETPMERWKRLQRARIAGQPSEAFEGAHDYESMVGGDEDPIQRWRMMQELRLKKEIADCVAFLSSPLSSSTTGQILAIDGGQSNY